MNATAPLVAGWNKRQWKPGLGINAPGPMNPAGQPFDTGPAGPIGLTVEICFDPIYEVWTDISRYVYYRDKIQVTRGRSDETTQPQPQSAALTLNNRDGRFSPRNAVGFWYGLIGRNTPIRISRKVNGSDIPYYRFWGEVPSWPTTTEISGTVTGASASNPAGCAIGTRCTTWSTQTHHSFRTPSLTLTPRATT